MHQFNLVGIQESCSIIILCIKYIKIMKIRSFILVMRAAPATLLFRDAIFAYKSILNAKSTGWKNLGRKMCTSSRDDRKFENTVKKS